MSTQYIPIIKVFDVSNIDIPQKITVTRRIDGKLWWKHTNVVPSAIHHISSIKIFDTGIVDRMQAYKFSQCLFNLILYNNFKLSKPQKFTFTVENEMNTFNYFIDEDEVIIIPNMPHHNQIIKMTLFQDKFPILKLQTKP